MTSPFPQIDSPPQASAEVLVNEALETLKHQAVYGKDQDNTSGLIWGYYGGRWGGFSVAAGTFTLGASGTNYIVVAIATGVTTCSTSTTNWNNTADYARVYKLTTSTTAVTAEEDHRAGPGGVHGGSGGTGGTGGGGATGLSFTSSTTTTDSDPGTGILRWNNATQASATILYIDNADADSTSVVTFWASLQAGTFIKITNAADADVWQLWKVNATPTNGTGYYKFAVTLQAQEGGNIANATSILLDIDAAAVASGDASTNTSSSVDGEGVLFSGTGGKTLKRATGTGLVKRTSGVDSVVTQTQAICIAASDESTALTTGTAKITFRMPFAFTLTDVRASVTTAPTGSGNLTVDVNESGTTILSTKLAFDASEKTTTTAATPRVISDTSLADDAEMTIDIDAVSGTITGAGLKVYLIGWPT